MSKPKIERDLIDFGNDTEVCNIGYAEGMIDDRPYRVEVWASNSITSATIFISSDELKEENIKSILVNSHIIEIIEDKILIEEIMDINDNKFYSINIPLEGKDVTINRLLVDTLPFD